VTLLGELSPGIRRLLEEVPGLVEKNFPLPGRFRRRLPGDIVELSALLTSRRGERGASYLGRPGYLSAYLRYFLPWNLYRLCRLLPGLPIALEEGDAVIDLGSGPLTLPAALWISRPELRGKSLEFRCLDRAAPALEAGKRFFATLAPGTPWKIRTISGTFGVPIRGKPPGLVSAVNFFNELYWDIPHSKSLEKTASAFGAALDRLAGGSVLVVEPGTPRAGEFIACLRAALVQRGRLPLAPCVHAGLCPCPGGKSGRWCHFGFDAAGAPSSLRNLSAASGLPKERIVLSFLLAGSRQAPVSFPSGSGGEMPVRVLSDPFPLGGGYSGRYGCSAAGLALLRFGQAGSPPAGSLVLAGSSGERDPKSGASVFTVSGGTSLPRS
jgi:hypothetical protein